MLYNEMQNIKKMKKALEVLAYSSLGLDCSIAFLTIMSLKKDNLSQFLGLFNDSLTIEVIITIILFTALIVFSNYKRIMKQIADFSFRYKHKLRQYL
ncbi:MAG: hypothetical protein M1331_01755 [Candidatus Marsarchaeota archaeon]|nr:hypothetical protein [Candidatus Marsarchaeota archaeon]MCL5106104.1 hypothetical protein [Candidatus Marsarchaeota archaeon]